MLGDIIMLKTLCNYIDGLVGIQSKAGASIRCMIVLAIFMASIAIAMMWPKQIEKILLWMRKEVLRFSLGIIVILAPSALFWRCLVAPITNIWSNNINSISLSS